MLWLEFVTVVNSRGNVVILIYTAQVNIVYMYYVYEGNLIYITSGSYSYGIYIIMRL